ncbi:MAG: hypothetical protein IPJ68_06140 [Candidatus Moraniibacteriota bacterium]|nr:MAG: hypothetical protein IPJ68_06140 [Candidatus Moranbacteria bacterium]
MLSPKKHKLKSKNIQRSFRRYFPGVVGFFLLTLASFLIATDIDAATGINKQISFQGKVVNTNGTNVSNGSYNFLFCLYTTASPATPCTAGSNNDAVWRESKSLTVTDGIFQSNLGDTTALPGSVDFNTDNIYLGINFNSDGQMSPLVRFTAAPYAMNAAKVGGLTVTDTTGTLTIPNAKTVQFADAFTTTGAFPLTLTSTASTTATLPSGTITLVDLATSQSLTNKTIGSTGLTFSGASTDITTATGEDLTVVANGAGIINLNDSVTTGALTISGATTDITTASGESLVIVANGAGVVDIQDATTVDSLTADTGGVSIASGQSYTGAGAVTLSSAATTALTVDSGTTGALNLGTSNNAKTISLGTGTAGNTINVGTDNTTKDTINIGSALDDVAITGDQWSITNAGVLTVVSCSGCGGGGGTLDSAYTAGNTITTDSGNNVIITLQEVATPTSFVVENQDTAGVSAERVFNSIASGTLTNGLLIEQAGAGTMTNAIQIAETAGTITDGILITGTLGNILNSPSLDITGAGAITGATGITSATGDITATAGNIVLNSTTRISNAGVGTFITGTVIGSQTFTTNNIADSGALTIASAAASALTLNSGTTGTIDIGTDASAETINIGNTGAAVKTIAIGNNSQANTITIGDASATSVSITDNNWSISTAGAGAFTSLSSTGAIAANGGITFDNTSDTVGSFTSSGTILMNSNILQDIGNTGTDFIASTGALTLAGVLTANGGITLAGSQSFAASALSYMDLGLITHSTTANQGLRLPNAASATPSNPTSGEGYLAWDAAGNQLITYNGSAWTTLTGSASDLQTAYNTDADGSNATISLTAADDGLIITNPTSAGNNLSAFTLQVSQLNTTAAITAIDIIQASNAANGVDITANAIDTETALAVTANVLTSGRALTLASSSVAFTGALESITLSGSNAANTGNLLLIADTGALNTTTSFKVTANGAATQVAALIENTGSGTSFRVNDVASDTDPFLIDATGNVGIGDATPNTILDVLSSGAADTVFTLANTNAGDFDPIVKFELTEGTPLFTLGIDDSDSDKFKIYSGDGLASGDEFVIDASGTTTIANLNLGATSFDTDAGAVTWIDMPVTSGAADNTVESYTSQLDGQSMLTVYALSDGAGSIDTRRVQLGDGGAGVAQPVLLGLDVRTGTGDPTDGFEGAMYYNTTDNVFRCYQNTGWTNCIGSGGSTDLQTAYNTDADGTNATISLTAADDGLIITNPTSAGNNLSAFTLQVSQLNTTAAITAIDIIQASNAANGVDITANAIDTETALTVTANALTTGRGLSIDAGNTMTTGGALSISGTTYVHGAETGSLVSLAVTDATTAAVTSTTNTLLVSPTINAPSGAATRTISGVSVTPTTTACAAGTCAVNGFNVGAITEGADAARFASTALNIGTGWDTFLDTASLDITGAGAITGATGVSTTTVTASSTIAANGGITFDNNTDTVGSFTSSGTILMNSNILQDIGNTGTDFIASTGALTLAGVLTANGGITLAASQTFTGSSLSYMDLGAITHGTTAVQGLRLPQAASASPSSPSSGEGYLAWDAGGNQVIYYNGAAWATFGAGGGYNLIKDEASSLTARTTLAFLGAGVSCADNASQTECTISGGAGSDLQGTYGADADGSNATISLTSADDSLVIRNPSSAGTDSAFTFKVEQLNTGIDNDVIYADNRGTGDGLRIDDTSGDTTPFIVDQHGRVGIGTASISGNASTERLLQVGSETTRGNSATYGEIISKGLNRHTALTNIQDIFVYDTTGDSDGGRWIDWATTDNLSWYSETLDDGPNDPCNIASDDRCYNSSFPRKAILVVTTDALYIFDAATNDMWMKFSQNASGYALGVDTNNDPSSVHALNGVVYVGANGTSAGGLYAIDFVNDRMWNYGGTNRSAADTGISGRNAAVTYNVDSNAKLEISPVGTQAEWERVNDVHAVVMSRTQSAVTALGSATNTNPGYGKVFIGLATDSGVTIINPSGQVLNQYSDVTADDYTAVALSSRGFMYALNTTQDQLERWDTIDTDKASEVNGTFSRKWDETIGTGPALASATFNIVAGMPDNLEIAERASNNLNTEDVIYVGHSLGMAELHEHTTQAFGWVKHYNATRQTPMMMLAGINDMVLPMDDTSGTQAQDLAIANTDMAIKGTPTLGVNGVQGKAINFDNTDDYLCSDNDQNNTCDVDTAFNMSTVGWTLSLWFRHSTTAPASGVDMLFEKCVTATPGQAIGCVAAYMTTTGVVVVANDDDATWTQGSSYDITATSTYAYNDNQWHNLIITRTNANDVDSWIDGQGMNLSTATGLTATFDGSQIVSIGASCVTTVTANCGAATNFWDGQIDDVQYIVGTTTQATMTQLYVRRYFNVERPRASKKTVSVTNATSASSTSLTDTGEAWYVNEFAGQIVEITGSDDADCIGITRRISSNTATALTFTPAVPGACTMDTSADFRIDPEKLYGASSSIAGIGITAETPLGEARQLCVGTNSGTDTGGVTCYNHQDGPSIVADVYHSQASKTDDSGTDWTGTDYDDIRAVDLSSRTLIIASEGHFTSRTEDVRLGQGLEYISNQLYAIRQEIVLDGITAVGSTGSEIGFTGGADLAERYYSNEALVAGEVVAIDSSLEAGVKKTVGAYQRDVLGIVATTPGIVLGAEAENGYPIALVGRVPVKVTNENGQIYAGDRVTAASRPGHAMLATQAGRVIGQALGDAVDWTVCEGEDPLNHDAVLCTTVMVFVNLSDYYGQPVELAMAARDAADAALAPEVGDEELGLSGAGTTVRLVTAAPTREEKIMAFLKEIRDERAQSNAAPSEVFTDRVAASTEIITPKLIVDEIFAKSIKADSIEGLSIWTDQIASLQEKYAGLEAAPLTDTTGTSAVPPSLAVAMKQLATDSITVQLDGSILGKLSVEGALRIGGDAQFDGNTVFARLASFLGDTLFQGKVFFEQAPTFGSNTAGFALIEQGAKHVRVSFDESYEEQPIVTITLARDTSLLLDEAASAELKADVAAVDQDFAETVFESDVRYIITEKDQTGFTILLSEAAPVDLQFSWVALAVKGAKPFVSDKRETSNQGESETVIPVPEPATPPSQVGVEPEPAPTPLPETLPADTSSDEASPPDTDPPVASSDIPPSGTI